MRAGVRVLGAALVLAGGASSALAEPPRPSARGLVAAVAVRAWQIRSYDGGPETLRGTAIAAALGRALGPRLRAAFELELARPGDDTRSLQAASGVVTYRLEPGLRLTAEVIAARLHLGHRGDYTGLGAGARVGYEVPVGAAVGLHAELGVRWLATLEDSSSYDAPSVPGAWLGVGVTWY